MCTFTFTENYEANPFPVIEVFVDTSTGPLGVGSTDIETKESLSVVLVRIQWGLYRNLFAEQRPSRSFPARVLEARGIVHSTVRLDVSRTADLKTGFHGLIACIFYVTGFLFVQFGTRRTISANDQAPFAGGAIGRFCCWWV